MVSGSRTVRVSEGDAEEVPWISVARSENGPVEAVIARKTGGSEQLDLPPIARGEPRSRFGPGRQTNVLMKWGWILRRP